MFSKHKKIKYNLLTFGIYLLLIVCLAEAAALLILHFNKTDQIADYIPPLHNLLPALPKKIEPEIKEIISARDLTKQVRSYKHLIERVGPIQAQDDLYTSGLPFDGETHLLNHTVGEWLYNKYKTTGLMYCKDYFLSSCYHGFVIDAIADGGITAMRSVMESCWKAPPGVSYQCSHAIGHGLLAFDGYKNLTQALADCDIVSQESKDFPTYNCYDGVFMENIWGIHNNGKPSPDRWINYNDPIYPCDDPRIAQKYIKACWSNQPQWMYQLMHADLTRISKECLKLSYNKNLEITCFNSIARQIEPVSNGSVDEMFRLCNFMPSDWINSCLIDNANSAFSVGDRNLPFIVCGRMKTQQAECFKTLSGQIQYITPNDAQQRKSLCGKIPDPSIQKRCLNGT